MNDQPFTHCVQLKDKTPDHSSLIILPSCLSKWAFSPRFDWGYICFLSLTVQSKRPCEISCRAKILPASDLSTYLWGP